MLTSILFMGLLGSLPESPAWADTDQDGISTERHTEENGGAFAEMRASH